MKKITLLVTIFMISINMSAKWIQTNNNTTLFSSSSQGLEKTTISFTLDGYEIENIYENGQTFSRISHSGDGDFVEVGKPDFPRFTKLIAIPNTGGVSFNIKSIEEDFISDVKPFPRQPLKKDNAENHFPFTIDTSFYNADSVFPADIINVGNPAIMRDVRVVAVSINPFQYIAQNNKIRIIKNIEIEIISNEENSINE